MEFAETSNSDMLVSIILETAGHRNVNENISSGEEAPFAVNVITPESRKTYSCCVEKRVPSRLLHALEARQRAIREYLHNHLGRRGGVAGARPRIGGRRVLFFAETGASPAWQKTIAPQGAWPPFFKLLFKLLLLIISGILTEYPASG